MPIFSHSDNSSLYPHQSAASGDGDGKHRQGLCSSFSGGEEIEPETGTSIIPCFFGGGVGGCACVHQYGAVNHVCNVRGRLCTSLLTKKG